MHSSMTVFRWWADATITASAEIASETLERAAEVLYQARVTEVGGTS